MNGKDLEGSSRSLIDVLCRHLPGGAEEYHSGLQNRQRPGLNKSRQSHRYEPMNLTIAVTRLFIYLLIFLRHFKEIRR
jgi:hypothetical protein